MLKRIKAIKLEKASVAIFYQTLGSDGDGNEKWFDQVIRGEYLANQLESAIIDFATEFLSRCGFGIDGDGGEVQQLTWSYSKYGPEIALKFLATGERCPKGVPLVLGGIGIAESDGGNRFTTIEEAKLLSKIADLALSEAKAFAAQHHQQLSLIDELAEIEEEKILGAA